MDIVRELVERVGIDGRGGRSRGATALHLAARSDNVKIMGILHAAGVRGISGLALCAAAMFGGEKGVKFLIQCSGWFVPTCSCQGAYANSALGTIGNPLLHCMMPPGMRDSSPRVTRILIDSGAVADFTFEREDSAGNVMYVTTPQELATTLIHDKSSDGISFTQKQMRGLKGVRKLLMQVAAVHAVSWGWVGTAAVSSTPRALKVPVRRESAARKKRVVRQALFR